LFPERPYKHRLESEGFGLLAADHGFLVCGLPLYDVRHFDEWAAERKLAAGGWKLAAGGSNSTNGTTESPSEAPKTATTTTLTTTAMPATKSQATTTTLTTTAVPATKSQVGGTVQMTVDSKMLQDPVAMETLKNATAQTIAEKAGVPRENVFVDAEKTETRRLESESSGKVILKLVYKIVVPEGVDASVIASKTEAIKPTTLTTAANQALSNAQLPYEITVDSITAAETTTTATLSPDEMDSSISMHGCSYFAVVLVTAGMAWGAS